jgi:hypothetical protein
MLVRARRDPDALVRAAALSDLGEVLRIPCSDPAQLRAAVVALEEAATRDDNAVLRDHARHSLASGAASVAFEAWLRVARPSETEYFAESLQMAERLADGSYASHIPGGDGRFEEHAVRALRLLEMLDTARNRLADANQILQSKATLIRLAERAVLQAQDPSTARQARLALEILRDDC